ALTTCNLQPAIDNSHSGVIASQDADDDALDFALVGVDDAGFHAGVGGLEADFVAGLAVEALEGGFTGVEEGDDLLAVAGAFAAEDALFLQGADVFEDGHLAGAELIGEFLHGGGVAIEMPIIANGHDDVELPRGEVHGRAPCREKDYRRTGVQSFGGCSEETLT